MENPSPRAVFGRPPGLFTVAGLIRDTENAANIIGMAVFSFGAVFLLYFFRYYYDKIILRLNRFRAGRGHLRRLQQGGGPCHGGCRRYSQRGRPLRALGPGDGDRGLEFNRSEYYKCFSAVFQEFSILPTSIAVNIAQSREDINKERIEEVLKLSGLYDKVQTLPQKEETRLCKDIFFDAEKTKRARFSAAARR